MGAMKAVHTVLRRHVRDTRTYNLLRRVNTFWSLKRGGVHETDYLGLPLIAADSGLFIDIGANAGQTAAGVAGLLPSHDIISFEPNPSLQDELGWVQNQIGARMRVEHTGLGRAEDKMVLHIPTSGDLAYEARASLIEGEARAHANALQTQLGKEVTLQRRNVAIRTLDSYEFAPDLIKIDVEGFESDVLLGAESTLMTHKPALIMERNSGTTVCRAWLAARGYVFFAFDAERSIFKADLEGALNFFAIPEERADQVPTLD
ncbi:MAG: FkbM family methyltransferase [Pseudomonadota bacterium]